MTSEKSHGSLLTTGFRIRLFHKQEVFKRMLYMFLQNEQYTPNASLNNQDNNVSVGHPYRGEFV